MKRRTSDEDTPVSQLKEQVRRFCEERDWDRFHGAKDLAIGVITEAAELLEHFRFQSGDEVDRLFDDPRKRVEIEAEIADVMIFVCRFAQKYDIDLSKAVATKLESNESRYPVEQFRGSNRKAHGGES